MWPNLVMKWALRCVQLAQQLPAVLASKVSYRLVVALRAICSRDRCNFGRLVRRTKARLGPRYAQGERNFHEGPLRAKLLACEKKIHGMTKE